MITKEEAIKNLEECVSILNYNIQLIKDGYRPCNEEWKKAADPLYKTMNYLINAHDDLIDMDEMRRITINS